MATESHVSTQRFEDYVRHHEREHQLLSIAHDAAKRAEDLRIERLNELQKTVEKDRDDFQKADVAEHVRQAFDERIRKLEQEGAGQRSANVTWIAAIAIIFTVIQIALRFVKF